MNKTENDPKTIHTLQLIHRSSSSTENGFYVKMFFLPVILRFLSFGLYAT